MTQLVFYDIKNEKEMLREDRIKIEPAFKKVEKLYEALDKYDFWILKRKVLHNPRRMTFNPAEVKMQEVYEYYVYNLSFKEYWRGNYNIRANVFFGFYILLILTLAIGMLYIDITNATTL